MHILQQRKEENGSSVAKNRSDIRSADDEVHEHQTRLVAYKSSLDKKRLDLEARNSGEDPQEVLGQKCSELQETVSALEHDSGQAKQLRKSLRGLRDQIEKAQMALDTHDEQEVRTLSCILCGCEVCDRPQCDHHSHSRTFAYRAWAGRPCPDVHCKYHMLLQVQYVVAG